jgi:hypothetical protein
LCLSPPVAPIRTFTAKTEGHFTAFGQVARG